MPQSAPYRVFISGVTQEMETYRTEVARVLRRREIEVRDQQHFRQGDSTLIQQLHNYIRQCDAVICLVGQQCGSLVTKEHATVLGPNSWFERYRMATECTVASYSQWEFLMAKELKRSTYTFLTPPVSNLDQPTEDTQAEQKLQVGYREWLQQIGEHYSSLTSINQLIEDILVLPFPNHSRSKPVHLPYRSIGSLFKGRDDVLEQLHDSLQRCDDTRTTAIPTIALHGLGGVGKTRCAVEYAWRYADDYSAVVFVAANSSEAIQQNLADLTRPLILALDANKSHTTEERVAAVLLWLAAHPGWMLILDNVDSEDAANGVEELLPKLQHGHVLITTRLRQWTTPVHTAQLALLSEDAATEFLIDRTMELGHEGRRTTATDATDARDLARDLGGLALALEQAACYVIRLRKSFSEYRKLWKKSSDDVFKWHDPRLMKYPHSIAITWQTTLAQLSAREQRLLFQLGWFCSKPIPLILFEQLREHKSRSCSLDSLETVIANLADFSMLTWNAEERTVTVHPVVMEVLRTTQPFPENSLLAVQLLFHRYMSKQDVNEPHMWSKWDSIESHLRFAMRAGRGHGIGKSTLQLMIKYAWIKYHEESTRLLGGQKGDVSRCVGEFPASINKMSQCNALVALLAVGVSAAVMEQGRQTSLAFEAALEFSEIHYGEHHPYTIYCLRQIIKLNRLRKQESKSVKLYRRLLTTLEAAYGPNHPKVAASLTRLARLLRKMSRPQEAATLIRRSLAIYEEAFGTHHPSVATALMALVNLIMITSGVAEAEPLCRRAAEIRETLFGSNHVAVAASLATLGRCLSLLGRNDEAESFHRRAFAIFETENGAEHRSTFGSLMSLAECLYSSGRFIEAESLYRRAVRICVALYGIDHDLTIHALQSLSVVLELTDCLSEAQLLRRHLSAQSGTQEKPLTSEAKLQLCQDKVAVLESMLGFYHVRVAACLEEWADFLCSINRSSDAEPLLRRSLAIYENSDGLEQFHVAACLYRLADVLSSNNRLHEAEPLLRRRLAIYEELDGLNHPNVAACLKDVADVLCSINCQPEAERLLRRRLSIYEIVYGSDHPYAAFSSRDLACLFFESQRTAEAEVLFRRANFIFETSFGPDDEDVSECLRNLALLLCSTDRHSEAESLYRRALAIDESRLGSKHPVVASVLNNLAALLRDTHRPAEAEPIYRRAIAIYEELCGTCDVSLAISLQGLGRVLAMQGRPDEAEPLIARSIAMLVAFEVEHGHEHHYRRLFCEIYEKVLLDGGHSAAATESRLVALLKPLGPE